MDYSERQERITFLLKEMLATDPITLTAALALLPDYSTEKAMCVIEATVQIGAEQYMDRTDVFLDGIKHLLEETVASLKANPD